MTLSLSHNCGRAGLLEKRKRIGETMLPVMLAWTHEKMGSREEKKCDKVKEMNKEMNIRVTSVNAPRNLHSEKLTVLSVDVR